MILGLISPNCKYLLMFAPIKYTKEKRNPTITLPKIYSIKTLGV